jgi:hypothetical protein
MYATAVGLVMNSTKINKKSNIKEDTDNNELEEIDDTIQSERLTIFEQFTEKIKTFLDNAE